MKKQHRPPRWAERFLQWYCKPELLEDLQGDLLEYFERHCKTKGAKRAKVIYTIDVLKFFRLYTIRKPEFLNLLIHWIMIGSYVKTSTRNIVRNKLFSFINIIGLAVSMSIGLLVIAMITDLFSYDDFHSKKERIYRVNTRDQRAESPPMDLATTSVKAGKSIMETFTGVNEVTLIRRGFGGDAKTGENAIRVNGFWADHSFFRVFSFPFLHGDSHSALKDPYSLVLTQQAAKKIFGNIDALGKMVKIDTTNYTVTGILEDIPKNSHITFEALASFSTVELARPNTDGDFFSWENIYMTYVYLVIPENSGSASLQKSLDRISKAENVGIKNRQISLWLQPLRDVPFNGRLSNPIGVTFNKLALWILIGLASVVILSASFNYTNLSLARAFRRSREVGIRKVIGALKGQVITQFITESVIISLLAFGFAFLIFFLLRSQLLSLHPVLANIFSLKLSPTLIGWFMLLAVGVGVLSGFLPALFYSKIHAMHVLKDASSLKVFRHISIRKTLIVVQYTFSLIFIATTLIGYNQYQGFITYDLGFKTKNILNIRIDGTNGDAFVKELSHLPEVKEISRSLIVTSLGSMYGRQAKYKSDSVNVNLNLVDEHYIPLHEHQMLAGRNFNPRPENSEESEVIVNEQLLKRLGIGDLQPEQALGEQIQLDKNLTIVGVIKDFHYGTLEEQIPPTLFRHDPIKSYGYINAKVETEDWPSTFAAIERAWKRVDSVHPLEAKFYDDQIEEAYSQFSVMVKVIGLVAFLAVCIASMGLFGMVVFTTETRLKEISIRKVLGAGEGTLIFLLSKSFLILLAISAVTALPVTYIFFEKVVLVNFAYHQPMGVYELAISLLAVVFLAFAMIGSQTFKAARTNPAEILKNE